MGLAKNALKANEKTMLSLEAELTQLRAEVERLTKERDDAKWQATEHQAKYVTMHGRHQELWRENLQLREDRRVLAEEVKAWRDTCGMFKAHNRKWVAEVHSENETHAAEEPMPTADATDASGVLGRVNGSQH